MDKKRTMPDFGGRHQIFRQEDGAMVFRINDPDEKLTMVKYSVFPGVDLIYNDIHARRSDVNMTGNQRNLLEIDHCRDGRMECRAGEDSFYLAPGDIALHRLGDSLRQEIFPTGHYHGITIQIDLDCIPEQLVTLLNTVDVDMTAIVRKLRLEDQFFYALRQLPSIEHIFSELYALPQSVKHGYFKIKIVELFLFLTGLEPEDETSEQRGLSENQVVLAKNVCSYLTEHIHRRITAAELAEQFGVSASQIQSSFSGVFGTSISAYMRGQRMQAAAKQLRTTDRTVLDIAGQFGYDNGSKFASAFRSVMGVTPTQYRNRLCHK